MATEEYFCSECFKATELVETVRKHGSSVAKCQICGAQDSIALAADHTQLKRVFRALIRVHYSEWQYNGHLGGDSLSTILFGQNAVMNLQATASAEEFENAFSYIEDGWYPAADEDISLGGGYWDGGIHIGLKARLSPSLATLINRSFNENYFLLQHDLTKLFLQSKPDIDASFEKGARLYRARIGVSERLTPTSPDFDTYYLYVAYTGGAIGSPPVHVASEGRLNRARVSLLYLASNRETAVAEVRPHPGHLVSTAEFEATRSLKIADLTSKDVRNFLSDTRLEELRLIFSFNSLMNLPVTPDQREFYLITQLLSDCVREAGFDGVKFQSSLGPGSNYAFFNTTDFALVPKSESVVAVKALAYEFTEVPTAPKDYDKDEFDAERDDPFSTLFELLERRK